VLRLQSAGWLELSAKSLPRRAAALVGCLCGVALARSAIAPAAGAAAPTRPEVKFEQGKDPTETSITLEANVDPEGAETNWEIYLECQAPPGSSLRSLPCEAATGGPQKHQGTIGAGAATELVQANLTGLRPGYTYSYSVIASNSAGKEGFVGSEFITCKAGNTCPSEDGVAGLPYWIVALDGRASEEIVKRYTEEEAALKIEERERAAYELKLRDEYERANREAAARELAASIVCVVPRLKGDTLVRARKVLREAHCTSGRVARSATGRHLVVIRQGVVAGRRLPKGAAVSLRLGHAPR
jgi:hypothetical protein